MENIFSLRDSLSYREVYIFSLEDSSQEGTYVGSLTFDGFLTHQFVVTGKNIKIYEFDEDDFLFMGKRSSTVNDLDIEKIVGNFCFIPISEKFICLRDKTALRVRDATTQEMDYYQSIGLFDVR